MLTRLEALAPDSIAISDRDGAWTYAELVQRIARIDVPSGAAVFIALDGGREMTALQLGIIQNGAIAVPVPVHATPREVEDYTRLVRPDVVLTRGDDAWSERFANLCRPPQSDLQDVPAMARFEGVAMIQMTSGSTGAFKPLLISKTNLLANIDATPRRGPTLVPMPQFHAMGNAAVLEAVLGGDGAHTLSGFMPADAMNAVGKYGCEAIVGPPSYVRLLTKFKALSAKNMPSLRLLELGAARTETALISEIRELRADLAIHIRYGLSEAVGALTRGEVTDTHVPGWVGPPVPGVELRVDDGRVFARGAIVAKAVLTQDGPAPIGDWLDTGDLGTRNDDGALILEGRASEIIKRQGYRISPIEIESVLRASPGVVDAVVVGVPDPAAGEQVVAWVEGGAELVETDLRVHCSTELSREKQPQRFVVGSLPRTPSGKPDRLAVRLRLQETSR